MNTDLMFSSESIEWGTPWWLYDVLDEEFSFDVDVCAREEDSLAPECFTPDMDSLSLEWTPGRTYFMNPPYGREISKWIEKARNSADQGAMVVCLLPGRIDTRWFWSFCSEGEVRILKGRLKFRDITPYPDDFPEEKKQNVTVAAFPSIVVVFHPYLAHQEIKLWPIERE